MCDDRHDSSNFIEKRLVDSMHFHLQQAINLKDDEISRLNNEILLIRAKTEEKSKILEEKLQKMKEEIRKLESELVLDKINTDISISRVSIEHQRKLKELAQSKIQSLENIQKGIENSDHIQKLISPNDESLEDLAEELEISRKNAEGVILQQEKKQSVENEYKSLQNQILNLTSKKESLKPNSISSDVDDKLRIMEQRHAEALKELRRKNQIAMDSIKSDIDFQRQRFERITASIEKVGNSNQKATPPKENYKTKGERLESLRRENLSLKREIGTLDYRIYGKSGKFSFWRKYKTNPMAAFNAPK